MTKIYKWRSRWDSNPRSPPWQGGMLTTTPLDQYLILNGADEGNWTPVSALARLCSTIELHLQEWRSRWDSNPRSPPWQGGMLTTTPLDHNFPKIRWRRRRDLNSRASFPTYTLSRGTSSATWVLLLARIVLVFHKTKFDFYLFCAVTQSILYALNIHLSTINIIFFNFF